MQMKQKLRRIPKMLYFRIISLVCCVLFPVFLAMTLFNIFSIHVIEEQVGASVKSSLSVYLSQVDVQMETLRQDLSDLAVNDENVLILDRLEICNKRTLAKVSLTKTLARHLVISDLLDMSFYYNPAKDLRTAAYASELSFSNRNAIWAYLQENCRETNTYGTGGWVHVEINGSYYLMFISPSKSGMVGALVGIDRIIMPLVRNNVNLHGIPLFVSDLGEPLGNYAEISGLGIDLNRDFSENYISGGKEDHLVVGAKSNEANVSLACVINEKRLLEGLPQLHSVLLSLCGLAAIGFFVLLTTMRRIIIKPLRVLVNAMGRFGNGDLEARIDEPAASEEMSLVYSSFNSMAQEIRHLTIAVYEERLKKQETELQALQLQVNPHFYINCINIIHNLAEKMDFLLIQRMTKLLSNYFRCMFADDLSYVSLEGELYQITQYLDIQEMRYPGHITYDQETLQYLGSVKIPRFVLMTFVENAVKHGMSGERALHISIAARLSLLDSAPAVEITIRDNGGGYPPEILEQLQREKPAIEEMPGHIGINNVIQRLELMYGDKHSLRFRNSGEGAEIMLTIPLKTEGAE